MTPFNERSLAPVRELLAYKRACVSAGKHVDGADSLDLEERLLATIDALADRVREAEERARIQSRVDREYAACREREAFQYRVLRTIQEHGIEAAGHLISQVGRVEP